MYVLPFQEHVCPVISRCYMTTDQPARVGTVSDIRDEETLCVNASLRLNDA